MVDYDGAVDRNMFFRGVECFADQTFTDFELLIFHDGPKTIPYEEELAGRRTPARVRFFCTEERENNWGHGNRNRGIHAATGDWIVHTNADNVFYPHALEKLAEIIRSDRKAAVNRRVDTTERQIVIFPILMRGVTPFRDRYVKRRDRPDEFFTVMSGTPLIRRNVDVMQFVMRRDLWLAEGGWTEFSGHADALIYGRLAEKYTIISAAEILGEHW